MWGKEFTIVYMKSDNETIAQNYLQSSMRQKIDTDYGIQRVVDELNRADLGYNRTGHIGLHVLSGYHLLEKETVKKTAHAGQMLHNILNKTGKLYIQAIRKRDKQLLDILETGILRIPQIRQFHRELFCSDRRTFPIIFRGDSPNGIQFSEFHAGLRGLGYLWAFRQIMEKTYGHCDTFSFQRLYKLLVDFRGRIVPGPVAICVDKRGRTYVREIDYLFKQLFGDSLLKIQRVSPLGNLGRSSGIDSRNLSNFILLLISPRWMYQGWTTFFCANAFKWTPLLQKVIFNNWFEIIQKYKNHAIAIEPPPNLFFEQKVSMALLWHLRYKEYFTEEERNIFPETYIINDGAVFEFSGRSYKIEDIISLPRAQRGFVIKYAGLEMQMNWGGKMVYRLRNLSKRSTRIIFARAIHSYAKDKEPWIIQKDISQRKIINFYDTEENKLQSENMYTLYRPYYNVAPNGKDVELIDMLVFFRKFFKVHAIEESVFGLVKVKNDE